MSQGKPWTWGSWMSSSNWWEEEVKTCTECDEEKRLSQFHWNDRKKKLGRRKACRSCQNRSQRAIGRKLRKDQPLAESKRQKKRYWDAKENGELVKDWVMAKYEGIPCPDCSRVYPWCCMDFDHRPTEEKSFNISDRCGLVLTSGVLANVVKEIDKCDLVCSNCHRIRTRDRNDND